MDWQAFENHNMMRKNNLVPAAGIEFGRSRSFEAD
ncbi:hypothetical protein SAMN05421866_1737 [Chryseobacterium oranimense]|uniref:Uncharacterized protein n=1 Tax=Chryseobacterium oranimense TaxID=421058 RepID=A0A1M5PAM9_9FLAO|nr:hypothetical protein SAMN05421866_1737 [Chryseobacterium oranimense]